MASFDGVSVSPDTLLVFFVKYGSSQVGNLRAFI